MGVSNVSPHLSGRLTLGMLMAAASKRESKDDNSFSIEKNNEFDRIKALLERSKD